MTDTRSVSPRSLADPFYYLANFQQVLDWVGASHGDLLDAAERAFLERFSLLPRASRALLVRMVMRKGSLFRSGRLSYGEIGCPLRAATPLIELGWVDDAPRLVLEELFDLLTRIEITQAFGLPASLTKRALLAHLRPGHEEARCLADWCPQLGERALLLRVDGMCERLRLMFFGNLRQDWSEFVLADLGIHRYERVAFSRESKAFHSRWEVDAYLHLHGCRERFEAGETVSDVLVDIPTAPYANAWLESRRGQLLLRLARQFEREGKLSEALRLYAGNRHPGARERVIRVLERCGQPEAAFELAMSAADAAESEEESQQLERILPRLRRTLGLEAPARRKAAAFEQLDLLLPRSEDPVELAVLRQLSRPDAPVHYVENALIGSLFGLLCWEALFAPLPGAFFHPFHGAPADLGRADFLARRADLFERCLGLLDRDGHVRAIHHAFREKHGLRSPFVAWELLDEALLTRALACIPGVHLRLFFERILRDIPANRSGLPDLIQFWPAERRYRMIEVKGPGDRLQDNQRRWLDYAVAHGLPVAVCHVRWSEEGPG
ncbi:VRR-NUC domain-containing protein [Azotobacter vinelandii]|uniref:VRR-NUC domain-containing protein n=1 Tax=Azotobacter vinelandii TaxID=354 RepID=UPI002666276B|nr:VRR-NUC domain-containing protein [Azotobacter vinelandii]WKN24258.1 VRR-NUC domain-containing protein [Azotobacter vinelandii]